MVGRCERTQVLAPRGRRHGGTVCWKETVRPSRERWLGSTENRSYSRLTRLRRPEDITGPREGAGLPGGGYPLSAARGHWRRGWYRCRVRLPVRRRRTTDLLKSRLSEFWLDLVLEELEATKTDCRGEGRRHTWPAQRALATGRSPQTALCA